MNICIKPSVYYLRHWVESTHAITIDAEIYPTTFIPTEEAFQMITDLQKEAKRDKIPYTELNLLIFLTLLRIESDPKYHKV